MLSGRGNGLLDLSGKGGELGLAGFGNLIHCLFPFVCGWWLTVEIISKLLGFGNSVFSKVLDFSPSSRPSLDCIS